MSFSTLGEAFALAREVLRVDMGVDLSPLRAAADPPPDGRRFLPRLGRRHTPTSQPFATQPCSRGSVPVVNVDCTVHVTAGTTGTSDRCTPRFASPEQFGTGPVDARRPAPQMRPGSASAAFESQK